ncbi:unnamed protein product [Protopolystoma xenopodis]|uniref:Uncharacterized protein n=1 Tax=Protopolystoma xenopodis TaxID=117903 RepID=A0A448WJD3_9PLAT|nr:unnamed protein product [Protopolystoma xenopodis]
MVEKGLIESGTRADLMKSFFSQRKPNPMTLFPPPIAMAIVGELRLADKRPPHHDILSSSERMPTLPPLSDMWQTGSENCKVIDLIVWGAGPVDMLVYAFVDSLVAGLLVASRPNVVCCQRDSIHFGTKEDVLHCFLTPILATLQLWKFPGQAS